jgi:hypothetical protein
MTHEEKMDTSIQILEKFIYALWGQHDRQDNIFLLERLAFSDNYNHGKGNIQTVMSLDISELMTYLQDNASTHDFSISPAIYNDSIRSYSNICGLYCFWAEFDYGTVGHKKRDLPFASKDDCVSTLKNNYIATGLHPNIIMNSGHGVHCYWLIDSNIIKYQTKKQVEQVNEWLFQVGIGINRNYYNEVKSIISLMRSPYPAVNRKISSSPVATKMIFTKQDIYSMDTIRKKIASYVIQKRHDKKVVLRKNKRHSSGGKAEVLRRGDIDLLETDENFMDWLSDSSDLSYYKSKLYEFDSTSAKEAWIFKYLYLCNLEVPEIYDFCNQYMDRRYHVFRTRSNRADRVKRIQYEINLALQRNTFPKKIKYEHKGSL